MENKRRKKPNLPKCCHMCLRGRELQDGEGKKEKLYDVVGWGIQQSQDKMKQMYTQRGERGQDIQDDIFRNKTWNST